MNDQNQNPTPDPNTPPPVYRDWREQQKSLAAPSRIQAPEQPLQARQARRQQPDCWFAVTVQVKVLHCEREPLAAAAPPAPRFRVMAEIETAPRTDCSWKSSLFAYRGQRALPQVRP